MGSSIIRALDAVDLTIEEGEFVAIMGPSGSGKSTLLNMLGFLDRPDEGSYHFIGTDVSAMDDDELSRIRNIHAGFVFQQFHLLSRMSAQANAELPLLYGGIKERHDTAYKYLDAVGLGERASHQPSELSGGEQQRVAIARSLVNGPDIIFADEPTGNLDTKSEEEIMAIIRELNSQGKTIVMVTHELEVAEYAKRIIRMRDGKIVGDENRIKKTRKKKVAEDHPAEEVPEHGNTELDSKGFSRANVFDYVRQAFSFMVAHKLRSFLSMLGILIGVSSVISMLAIGDGAKKSIEERLSSLGSNLLTIRAGAASSGGARLQVGSVDRMTMDDVTVLAQLDGIKNISPVVRDRAQLVYDGDNWNTQLMGTSVDYFEMQSIEPETGRSFSQREVVTRRMVAVVGQTVVDELFGGKNPVGEHIRINTLLFTVIGVIPSKGMSFMQDQDDMVIIPIDTALYRVLGTSYVQSIMVEVEDESEITEISDSATALLNKKHHVTESTSSFEVMDMTEIRETMSSTTETMSLLLGFVAAISLVVGGIGIMNIMLVSVKERTREIGLRKAIGARRKDILLQFLIEALLMTVCGGLLGIIIGVGVSFIIAAVSGWSIYISPFAITLATIFSMAIGVVFGFWPAMLASELEPIEALHYE